MRIVALLSVVAPFVALAHGKETNLKVLHDVPHAALEKGMKALTGGLGVKCTACHVRGKYAIDDKKEKLAARTFIEAGRADPAARLTLLAELSKALGIEAPKDAAKALSAFDLWKPTKR
jgi:hypothetical protein